MKRFVLFVFALFICLGAIAETVNIDWKVGNTTYSQSTCEMGADLILPTTTPTKTGYTFRGWRIAGYTPIEYLESTGTQYITLNVGQNGQSKIMESEIMFTKISTHAICIGNTDNIMMSLFQIDTNTNNWAVYAISKSDPIRTSIPVKMDTKYKIKFYYESGNTQFYVDGYLIVHSNKEGTVGQKFTLFANYSTNSHMYSNFAYARIYNFKVFDINNNLLVELIPVLDANGTPCMFDKVEGKFYYNQGTGQFIAGPVLNE